MSETLTTGSIAELRCAAGIRERVTIRRHRRKWDREQVAARN